MIVLLKIEFCFVSETEGCDSNPGSNLGPPIIPRINTLITQLLFEFAVNIQFRIEKMNVLHRKNVHCYYKQLIFRFTHDRKHANKSK